MGRMVTQQNLTHVRPSRLQDVAAIANDMRQADVDECKAQADACPKGSLLYCFFMSKPCMTLVSWNGEPISMWGVIPEGLNTGRIWLLGREAMLDDLVDKHYFLRECKIQLKKIYEQYPVLFNLVDARNKIHLRWIQWMGFTFIRKHPEWGPESRLFYEFVGISNV
jgi:hypothetical protein